MKTRIETGRLVAMSLLLLLALAACGSPEQSATATSPDRSQPVRRQGGEAIVLLGADFAGAWPAGLDPATNITGGSNLSLMNAIYGGLFQMTEEEDGSNPRIVGVLAEGYEISKDGLTVTLRLRPGVTFSDGTPFDAEAVRFNIERSLTSQCACSPVGWPWAEKDRVTVADERTVIMRFSNAYGPVMHAFPTTNLNWIGSPAAIRTLGDRFKITPVGAGPFRVVSNQLSSKLVLERNPRYWQQGRPYLDKLVFQSIGSEQAAYQALLAGHAHAYEGMSSTLLIEQAQSNPGLTVTRQPSTSPLVVQLNTHIAPFDNQRAREALYFATNVEAIRKGLFKNWYPASQSFTAPGGLFHRDTIPGYRTYDIERARAIVKELGGMKITLGTLRSFVPEQVMTALQTQWKEAGIDVSIEGHDLATLIGRFQSGKWQAMLQTAGSYDPELGAGLGFRFRSLSPFSGVMDAELDRLTLAATATVDPKERDDLYFQIAKYLSDHAYAPFIVAVAPAQLTRGLHGPGLTTKIPPLLINPAVWWQDAWLEAK